MKKPRQPRLDLQALRQILVEGALDDRKVMIREMGLLKRLRKEYAPLEFWVTLRPAIRLTSLLYFFTDYGKECLEREWRDYRNSAALKVAADSAELDHAIEALERKISLDTDDKSPIVNPLPRKRKHSPIEWADSTL